ncbi:MAG TPA: ice-binding family protein [Gaiellaceae bacterium]|nr:ice-binding family protein [Gaiellaceae bacterium]
MKNSPARTPAVFASCVAVLLVVFAGTAAAAQAPVPLANAATFGALSSAAMTNAGLDTVVTGNVGSSTSIDVGVTHPGYARYGAGSSELANAQASLLAAYLNAEAQTPTGSITGMNLAGQTLTPGVYNSTGSILISGPVPLTLNGGGNADAVFIFQAAASGDLTVAPTSRVVLTNSAQPCNVFWKVNSAFLQNTGFTFAGTILALTQITLTDNITVEGRVLARNADVTFIHDVVNRPSACIKQADVDSATAAAAAASAAATAAAQASAAANKAAAEAEAKATAAATAESARVAADKARVEAERAAEAQAKAAAAAATAVSAAKAADAAKVAAAVAVAKREAATAKAAAAKAKRAAALAKAAAARTAAVAARRASARGPALPAKNPSGFTG